MNINLTLIVQAVNFFIAYIIIEKLLFKPIIALLMQEEADIQKLAEAIAHQEHNIMAIEKATREKAQQAKELFKKYTPPLFFHMPILTLSPLKMKPIDQSLQEAEVIRLRNALAERIIS